MQIQQLHAFSKQLPLSNAFVVTSNISTLLLPSSYLPLPHSLDSAVHPVGQLHTRGVKEPRHNLREVEHDDEAEEEAEQERGLESEDTSIGEGPPRRIVPSIVQMLKVRRSVHFGGVLESCEVVEADCEGSDDLCVDKVQGEGVSSEICRDMC